MNCGGDVVGSPDEYPFTPDLSDPVLKPIDFLKILYPSTIHANPPNLSSHTRRVVLRITSRLPSGNSQLLSGKRATTNTGTTGTAVALPRSMSRFSRRSPAASAAICLLDRPPDHRFRKADHFPLSLKYLSERPRTPFIPSLSRKPGEFVSESKLLSDPAAFTSDAQPGTFRWLITKPGVEWRLLRKLCKVTVYTQDPAADGSTSQDWMGKVDVDEIIDLYEHYILRWPGRSKGVLVP